MGESGLSTFLCLLHLFGLLCCPLLEFDEFCVYAVENLLFAVDCSFLCRSPSLLKAGLAHRVRRLVGLADRTQVIIRNLSPKFNLFWEDSFKSVFDLDDRLDLLRVNIRSHIHFAHNTYILLLCKLHPDPVSNLHLASILHLGSVLHLASVFDLASVLHLASVFDLCFRLYTIARLPLKLERQNH